MRALTARGGPLGELMRAIEKDEARWCAMLAGHLRMLGQPPSSKLGAFYEKAMAISDLGERIAFLNRGQGWVVRKLRELLPRVRDNSLHTDLSEMLRSHEANIALATEVSRSPHSTHLIDLRLSPSRENQAISWREGPTVRIPVLPPRSPSRRCLPWLH